MYRKLLWLAIIVLLIGCTTTETASRKAQKVWSTYSGNVVSSCWDMSITVYLLEKTSLPNEMEIEMLFESIPTTGFHYGRMRYNGRYYQVLAKVEDLYGSSCERPLQFLCSVDKYPNPQDLVVNR